MSGSNGSSIPGPTCSGREPLALDQPISLLDQKQGGSVGSIPKSMTEPRMGRVGPTLDRRSSPTIRIALTVAGALLLLLPLASTASAATAWDPTPRSWTNGTVLCEFAPTAPTVSVSALSRAGTGLTVSALSLAEVGPTGMAVARSNLGTAAWTGANDSSTEAYDLAYSVTANVTSVGASTHTLGTVELRVDYVLPAYDDSGEGSVSSVAVDFQLAGWPWQSEGDHLVLTFGAVPSFLGEETIVLGASGGSLLTSVSDSSGAAFERMNGAPEANVTSSFGALTPVPATASVVGNGTAATIGVAIGSSAGAFSSLNYSASVEVLFPATIAGIPTVDLVAVGGVAALISGLVAVGVRRARGRPSDLTFVETEEP